MKRILLLGTIIIFAINGNSQIRIIEHGEVDSGVIIVPGGTEDLSGTTQFVPIESDDNTYKKVVWIVNESETETYEVVCRRLESDVVPSTLNNTCWRQCPFPDKLAGEIPNWIVAPTSGNPFVEIIAPGDTIVSFEQKYFPEFNTGCSTFEILFENANNLGEVYTSFYIEFGTSDCIDGIGEVDKPLQVSMSPNPADGTVSLDLDAVTGEVAIKIYNVLGEVMIDRTKVQGRQKFEVETSELQSGIYMVSVLENGRIINTSRLMIRH